MAYGPIQYTDSKKSVIDQAKEIIDSNPELKKSLEKDYGNENVDFGIVKDANIKRTLVANSGSSTISVAVKYSGNGSISDFLVYDEIPKSFAENIKDIKIRATSSKERTVINEDPILLFKYENVEPGKEFEIIYEVNKKVKIDVLDEFKQPVILEKVKPSINIIESKDNNQISRSKNYILFIIIGIVVIIVLIYFVIKKDKKF